MERDIFWPQAELFVEGATTTTGRSRGRRARARERTVAPAGSRPSSFETRIAGRGGGMEREGVWRWEGRGEVRKLRWRFNGEEGGSGWRKAAALVEGIVCPKN